MRLRYPLVVAALALVLAVPAAQADTGFSCTLNGAQAGTPSLGTGSGTVVVANSQLSLVYNVTYTGLGTNRTNQHIHGPAAPGATAGVIVPFTGTGTTSGTLAGTAACTPTIVGYMLAGNTYVNIHSSGYPAGEIRGQLYTDATPARGTSWSRIKTLYK